MSTLFATSRERVSPGGRGAGSGSTLASAVLGFFVITLDAVVVNVALLSIRRDLGGGIAGLQWVVDGFTLMFAALLLSAGALSDRVGARRAFATGLAAFIVASAACALAPNLGALGAVRLGRAGDRRPGDACTHLRGHRGRRRWVCRAPGGDRLRGGGSGVGRLSSSTGARSSPHAAH